jgi:hypothetical protein
MLRVKFDVSFAALSFEIALAYKEDHGAIVTIFSRE